MVNGGDDTVLVLFNDGTGTFADGGTYGVGNWPNSIAIGDLCRRDVGEFREAASEIYRRWRWEASASRYPLPTSAQNAPLKPAGETIRDRQPNLGII